MADSFKRFQETFEIFANQQAVEIEAVRAVLQGFLVSILSNHPQGAAPVAARATHGHMAAVTCS